MPTNERYDELAAALQTPSIREALEREMRECRGDLEDLGPDAVGACSVCRVIAEALEHHGG